LSFFTDSQNDSWTALPTIFTNHSGSTGFHWMHFPTGHRKLSIVKVNGHAKTTEEEIRPPLVYSDDPGGSGVQAGDPVDLPEDPTNLLEQEDHQDPSRGR
jgi:hypothetical protein